MADDQEQSYEEKWKKEQLEETREVVAALVDMAERLKQLPANREDARKIVAADNVGDLVRVVNEMEPTELSRLQLLSAALRGRGLKHSEIADILDIPNGAATLHVWENTILPYKRAIRYWRRIAEEDQLAMAIREIEEVAESTSDPGLMIKLIRLRLLLADKPEDRERWQKEIELREREVAAREKEVDVGTGSKPPFAVPAFIDADFTAVDDDRTNNVEAQEDAQDD